MASRGILPFLNRLLRQTGGNVRTVVTGAIALSVVLAAGGICSAQFVAKREPLDMRPGARVLVDDGTCGKGKIKLMINTGGNGDEVRGGPPRTRTCVLRQDALR
jgi:hypothetical protein